MLAAQHIGGGVLLLIGAAFVLWGIAVNQTQHGAWFYLPGAAMVAAGVYLVTR
ncbi:MAG TPA: hypothetical protein VN639_15760 [Azonexus sp.]|nr:hypothetical protein [Azonexus sp.]